MQHLGESPNQDAHTHTLCQITHSLFLNCELALLLYASCIFSLLILFLCHTPQPSILWWEGHIFRVNWLAYYSHVIRDATILPIIHVLCSFFSPFLYNRPSDVNQKKEATQPNGCGQNSLSWYPADYILYPRLCYLLSIIKFWAHWKKKKNHTQFKFVWYLLPLGEKVRDVWWEWSEGDHRSRAGGGPGWVCMLKFHLYFTVIR